MSLILNDGIVEIPAESPEMPLLDFIRNQRGLTAAKPGCGTGDCGSCLVLAGEIATGETQARYRTVNSCLMTLADAEGCHIITPEGLNGPALSPVQQALVEHGAVQCGYCTPGLVMALTGTLLNGESPVEAAAGNLCRCTGYAGIRRACEALDTQFIRRERSLDEAAEPGLLPATVAAASAGLKPLAEQKQPTIENQPRFRAGNTDLGVQHAHQAYDATASLGLHRVPSLRAITLHEGYVSVGAAVTVAELRQDETLNEEWPLLGHFLNQFASPSIRHMATVGGNLVNASPVADLAVALLAMDAALVLQTATAERICPLADFYLAYHQTALRPDELLTAIRIPRNATASSRFHAEKVAKRERDDIATVNSAMTVTDGLPGCFGEVRISAGGVAAFPKVLTATSAFLSGKPVNALVIRDAMTLVEGEISPMDDLRGSADYKCRLLQHLLLAHVLALFPELRLEDCLP